MKPILLYRAARGQPLLTYSWVLLLIAVVLYAGKVAADPVATVINLSEPSQLLAKKSDGKVKVLIQGSQVDNRDVIESQGNTYARLKFIDGAEITLSPNTRFKIDNYSYNKDKPKEDRSVFTLVAGTLRSITGAVGHRDNTRYQLNTPSATIGIRGTSYVARYTSENDATALNEKEKRDCDPHHSGLIVQVIGGVISLTNDGGTRTYEAGQYGCATTYQQPPVLLPKDPGIQFSPIFGKSSIQCTVN